MAAGVPHHRREPATLPTIRPASISVARLLSAVFEFHPVSCEGRMSEIDKVTRLLELATMHRLREELDLASADTSETAGPQSSPEELPVITENEKAEPVRS
jgi:hypothetical protein